MTVGANWKHLALRSNRVGNCPESLIKRAMSSLVRRFKQRTMPNGKWYRTVKDNENNTVVIICGQGNYVSTILSADMTPHGKEV